MARAKPVVILENRVRFTTTQPVAVEDVISSLQGMDRLVRYNLPKVIMRLTGAKIESAELLVVGLEDGSLIEDTLVRLVFKSPEDMHRFISGIRSKFVTQDAEGNTVIKPQAIVPIIAALGLVAVIYYVGTQSNPGGGLINIRGNDNIVITIGAEAYKTNPQEFQTAVESAISKQRPTQAAKAGLQLFAPASAEDGAGVEMLSGRKSVPVVAPSTIKKLPDEIEAADRSQDAHYNNVEVNLRASDSDSESRGWAGTIDGVADKRARVIFVNPSDVHKALYRPSIRADVTVTYSDATHTRPVLILVEKVL